jgi:hypothetical protein
MGGIVYDFGGLPGVTYSLDPDLFIAQIRGRDLETRIPVRAIEGFYVSTPAADASADPARRVGELLIAWVEGTEVKRKAFAAINVAAPRFQALADQLARFRPLADLRALPKKEAQARLGMRSDGSRGLAAFLVATVMCLLGGLALAEQLSPDPLRDDQPGWGRGPTTMGEEPLGSTR